MNSTELKLREIYNKPQMTIRIVRPGPTHLSTLLSIALKGT